MDSITSSLFGLVKNHAGFYASEKQAKFLSAKCCNEWLIRTSVTFGEYEGRTSRNTRGIDWVFVLDAQGIVSVTKNGKGWFVRGGIDTKQQAEDKKAYKAILSDAIATLYREADNSQTRQKAISDKVWDRLINIHTTKGRSVASQVGEAWGCRLNFLTKGETKYTKALSAFLKWNAA